MLGITSFGMFHTVISLIAVIAGIIALVRDGRISPRNRVGQTYVIMTILTCITGFFIFHHGGFGKPHVLGIITLVAIAVALVAGYSNLYGKFSRYIETVAYSLTFFFHWIPAITETSTRLPAGAPLLSSPDAPQLQMATAGLFVLFLIGAIWQVLRLRANK
jgi:uncharacterized membrane protein